MGTAASSLLSVPHPHGCPRASRDDSHTATATCPWLALPGGHQRPSPAPPLPEPEMWTRSGRPLLETEDRSLWERPRGLGSPGSQRRTGTGGPGASGSGSRSASATASWPAGWSGDIAGLLPASAIGPRLREGASSGRVGPAQRAALSAAAPRGAPGRLAGRGGGRRQRCAAREEEEHRKVCTGRSRLQPALALAGDSPGAPKPAALGAGEPAWLLHPQARPLHRKAGVCSRWPSKAHPAGLGEVEFKLQSCVAVLQGQG